MNLELVEKIANAVLYEGYILYPYRPSSVKNRQRWTFGGLYPRQYVVSQDGIAGTSDLWTIQTECLAQADEQATIDVKLRCLHLVERQVRELDKPSSELPNDVEAASRPVAWLQVGERLFQTWQEAVERQATCAGLRVGDLLAEAHDLSFSFPPRYDVEPLQASSGELVGVIVREQQRIDGSLSVRAQPVRDGLFKITVQITNLTPWEAGHTEASRDEALMRALVSTHAILGISRGEFVSLLEPPDELKEAAEECHNAGMWPVLAGEEGERDAVLASPIILYDYPQIAPESPGDLFDGTEIDEILTLRIMTMTDEEKREMSAVDERARALLARTEALTRDQLMSLHGTVRSLRSLPEERVGDKAGNG
jgi:hypothetical protein